MTSSVSMPPPAGETSADPIPPSDAGNGVEPDEDAGARADEVVRLRAEVAALQSQLDGRRRRSFSLRALRRAAAAVLIAVTAFAMVASVVGLWAATTTLNTNRWVSTVAPLPRDPQVAAAVAQYATDQIFEVVNVDQRLSAVLPPQAAFIAGPLAGQVRGALQKTVGNILVSDRFQPIWIEVNRRAHQRALSIINGDSTVAVARQDRVDIDLLPLINQVLRALSANLPTIFGKQITLPDLDSGAIPANLRERVQDALGVQLPPNFAQFTVYDAGQLWAIQRAVSVAKRDLAAFVIATVLLLVTALVVAPSRRRTVLQLGIWLVVAAVAVTAALRAVRREILAEVTPGLYRDGVGAALTVVFRVLRERGTQLIWIGVLLAVVAYLVGPGRAPVWLRRQTARGGRRMGSGLRTGSRSVVSQGPPWIARHRDVVRIAGVAVAVLVALVSSSWTAFLAIVIVLAVYELVVTLVARAGARRDTPDPTASGAAVPG